MDPMSEMTERHNHARTSAPSQKTGGTAHLVGSVAWAAGAFGPKPVFAPDGLADIATTSPAPAAPAAPELPTPPTPEAKVERPDWLPETMWDAEKGFKKDDFDALVASKAERDSALASVPEKAEGYSVQLPADFKLPEGFEVADGTDLIDANDPRVVGLRELAHSEGWTQTQFEKVLAFGVSQEIASESELKTALSKEVEKLGGRGVERVKAVTTWLSAKLGAEGAKELHHMLYTSKQVESFERLMQLFKGDVRGNPNGGRDNLSSELSDEDYDKMTPTQKINYARSANAGR
ncbi:hypothetical protein ACTOV4_00605 [Brucella sp. C7-11G]